MNAVFGRTLLKRATGMRNYSSLREIIPPNIGFAARAGESTAEATSSTLSSQQVSKIVSLYRGLPKGQAEPKAAPRGPFGKYYARYFQGENASAAPIVHFIAVMLVGGYSIHYITHLRHHKHAEHH